MNAFRHTLFFLPLGTVLLGLVLKSAECVEAAREALSLCAQTLIPTLFPFFVLSSLAVSCGGAAVSSLLRPLMRPLFSLSGSAGGALALGLLGGYPVGARTAGELYREGALSRREAERLLAFCNNSGPGFILGFCGAGIFQNSRAGIYLYLVHTAAALLTGLFLRRGRAETETKSLLKKPQSFFLAFPAAVTSSFAATLNVCAFVVLFMVLLRLLSLLPPLAALGVLPRSCLFGFLELTNGIAALPPTKTGFVACAAILGWGGMSVHAQALAVLEGTGLSTRQYFLGKALHALLSIPLALLAAARLF